MRRGWILNPVLVLINVLAVIPHARPLPLDQELGASSNGTEEARTSLSAVAVAVEQPPTIVVVPLTPIGPDEAENATSKTPVERGTEEAVTSTVTVVVDTGTTEDEAVTSTKDVRDTIDLLDVDLDGESDGDEGAFEEDIAAASGQDLSLVEKDRDERGVLATRTRSGKQGQEFESQSKKLMKKLTAEAKKNTVKNNDAGVSKVGTAAAPHKNKEAGQPTIQLKAIPVASPLHPAEKGVQNTNNRGSEKEPSNKATIQPQKQPEVSQSQTSLAPVKTPQQKVPEVGEKPAGKEQNGDTRSEKDSENSKPASPFGGPPPPPPPQAGANGANSKAEADSKGTITKNNQVTSGGASKPNTQIQEGAASSGAKEEGVKGNEQGNKGQPTAATTSTNKAPANTGTTVVVDATASSGSSQRPTTHVSPPSLTHPPAELIHPVSLPIPPYYVPGPYLAATSYPVVNTPNYYGKPAQPPLPQPYTYQPDYSHYPMYSPPVPVYAPNRGYRPAAPYGYPPTNLAVYSPVQPPPPPPPPQPATYSQHKQYRPSSYQGEPPATRGSSYTSNPPRRINYPPNTQTSKYRPTPYKPSAPPTRTYKKVDEPLPKRRNPYSPNGQNYQPYKKPSAPTPTYTRKPGSQYKPKVYTDGPYQKPSPAYVPPMSPRPQAKPVYKPDADEYSIRPAENPYKTDDDDDNKSGDTGNIYGYKPYETPKPKKPSMPTKKKIVYPTPVAEHYDEPRPYEEDRPAEREEYEEKKYRKTPYGRPSSPYPDTQPEDTPVYRGEDDDEPYSTKTYPTTPYKSDPYAPEKEYEPSGYPDVNEEAPEQEEPEPASYSYPATAPRKQRPPQYPPNRYDRPPPAPTPYREKQNYEDDGHREEPYHESGPDYRVPEENDDYAGSAGQPYRRDDEKGEEYDTEPGPEYTETETERYRPPYGENKYRPRARSDYVDEGEVAIAYGEPTYDTNPPPDNYQEEEQEATTYDPPNQYRQEEEDPPAPMYDYENGSTPEPEPADADGGQEYPDEVPYGQVEQVDADELEKYGEVEQDQYEEPEEGDSYSDARTTFGSSTTDTTQQITDTGSVLSDAIAG